MGVILDANILFRTLISSGDITELFFNKNLEIFAPEKLREEFLNNRNEMLEKSKLSIKEFDKLTSLLFKRITFVTLNEYQKFLPKARILLKGHTKDEDFIAVCLLKKSKLWTYEKFLFKIDFGVSTKQISKNLSNTNV